MRIADRPSTPFRLPYTVNGGVEVEVSLANPLQRGLAWLLDFFFVMVMLNILSVIVQFTFVLDPDLARAINILIYFILSLGYGIVMEWSFHGQTVGKRLFQCKVVSSSGAPLRFHQVLMRNLFRFIDGLPAFYLIGGLCATLSPRGQRLGDLAANTIVASNARKTLEMNVEGLNNRFNTLREDPIWRARVRRDITPAQASLLLSAVLRAETLDNDSRQSLFQELAKDTSEMLQLPAEWTATIPPEQQVRNIVEVLWKRGAVGLEEP